MTNPHTMKYFSLNVLLVGILLVGLAACKGSRNSNSDTTKNDPAQGEKAGMSPTDRIIFHTGVCFGACPDYCMSVDRSGKVEYWGGIYAKKSGFYTAQAPEAVVAELESIFESSDWDTLGTQYKAGWTDDRSVNLNLVKNGRIVHSLTDYGAQLKGVAAECYGAMNMIYEQASFEKMPAELFTCWQFAPTDFNVEGSIHPMTKAEMFFLWQEWRRNQANVRTTEEGPFTEAEEPFYVFGKNKIFNQEPAPREPNCLGDAPAVLKLYTNGQIFTLQYKEGGQTKIDVGYSFFQENKFANSPVKDSK